MFSQNAARSARRRSGAGVTFLETLRCVTRALPYLLAGALCLRRAARDAARAARRKTGKTLPCRARGAAAHAAAARCREGAKNAAQNARRARCADFHCWLLAAPARIKQRKEKKALLLALFLILRALDLSFSHLSCACACTGRSAARFIFQTAAIFLHATPRFLFFLTGLSFISFVGLISPLLFPFLVAAFSFLFSLAHLIFVPATLSFGWVVLYLINSVRTRAFQLRVCMRYSVATSLILARPRSGRRRYAVIAPRTSSFLVTSLSFVVDTMPLTLYLSHLSFLLFHSSTDI